MTIRRILIPFAVLLAAVAAAAPVTQAKPTPRVDYPTLQKQIAAHQVTHATINRKAHDVKVTLSNGARELVVYPPHSEPQLAAALQTAGATVKIKKKKKKVKAAGHHLRYIAAGGLVVIAAIGGAVYMVGRRRQLGDAS